MRERLQARDVRFLVVCLVILAGTVWFAAKFFYRAFPEASIDFVVTRDQARGLAERFLAGRGERVEGYRQASRFRFDNEEKTFLERELGLEQANQILGRRVRLWRWSYRWFRPQQKEEYRVEVTPRGEVVGFQHQIEEGEKGARLERDQARGLAESFLAQAMGTKLEELELADQWSTERPGRTDHVFTWQNRDFRVKDATYRLEVTVAGERIGGYREYLKVPEAWKRDYERLRSRNNVAQIFDTGLTVLLALGALVTLLGRIGRRDIRWRRALGFGATGAVLLFLASWNSFPQAEFAYPTTDSYASFLVNRFLSALLGALGGGALIAALTAAAEPLYRESMGRQLSLGNLFRWRGVRTKSFFLGSALGLTLCGVFVAYQTAFYLVAYRWGAWSPADVPYDDLLNTRLPWLFVLLGGFLPAVSEEFLFRMFAIPFLRRLVRATAVAVVAAGFLWGFGHSAYPQQPFYIRGVEVGIGGVALGYVMLRWGILPTLVWHYSVDALYTALLLLRSSNPYFVVSGAASAGLMALPLLAAAVAYWRGRGFEPEQELWNEREAAPAAEAPETETAVVSEGVYEAWTPRRRAAALGLAAAALAVLLVPGERFGGFSRVRMTAAAAQRTADGFVRELGMDPGRFRTITYLENEFSRPSTCCGPGTRQVGKYFLERRTVGFVREACRKLVPLHSWTVRYYRPLEKEELRVRLHPETGQVIGFEHRLAEEAPGADLGAEEAQKIASAYVAARGFDLGTLESKETTSEKRKQRRDHTLVWEAKAGDPRHVEEARYRVRAEVAGDQVASLRTLWKLPEGFVRERGRRNALANTLFVLKFAVIGGGVLAALYLLIQRTRKGLLKWKQALGVAVAPAALGVVSLAWGYGQTYQRYDTAIPLGAFQAVMVVGLGIAWVGMLVMLVCAAALVLAVRPQARETLRRENRRRCGRDALVAAALALAATLAFGHLRGLVMDRFHAQALLSTEAPAEFAVAWPAVPALAASAGAILSYSGLLALAVFVAEALGRRRWATAALGLVAVAALVPLEVHTAGEFALHYGLRLAAAGAVAAWVVWYARSNYLAYVLAFWVWVVEDQAGQFLAQPATEFQRQGWVLVAAGIVGVVWAVWPAFAAGPRGSTLDFSSTPAV